MRCDATNLPRRRGIKLKILVIDDSDGLQRLAEIARAVVLLTSPWSCYERQARATIQSAATKLAALSPEIGVEFRSVDEEAEYCQSWLRTLGVPIVDNGPIGAGTVLWMEFGKVVASEINGSTLRVVDVLKRCRAHWAG